MLHVPTTKIRKIQGISLRKLEDVDMNETGIGWERENCY